MMEEKASKEEANVLVTGFGPFRQFTTNASYEIARILPTTISPHPNPNTPSTIKRINLIVRHPYIRTSYHDVRTQLPPFYALHGEKDIDLVLHLGSGYKDHYQIEQGASRDGYNNLIDEDGKLARDLGDLPGGENLWRDEYHAPDYLEADVKPFGRLLEDTISLLRDEGKEAEMPDVRLNDDAGDFMCGFIYYAGLVERWRKGEERKVVFVHVRSGIEEKTVEEGRSVALAVIRAALGMIEEKRLEKLEEAVKGKGG